MPSATARDELVELSMELLAPAGAVRARRMFGGHGLYVDDLFVAIIAMGRLYLKADDTTRAQFEGAGCEPFEYSAKDRSVTLGYWSAPAEAMESPALMLPWVRLALQAALRARGAPAKRKSRKSA
jgi:DNA transformation protein and related proteins